MTHTDYIEAVLNTCSPPLTLQHKLPNHISIISGKCAMLSTTLLCADCVFFTLRSDQGCTIKIPAHWPAHFPHIAEQFPELLL